MNLQKSNNYPKKTISSEGWSPITLIATYEGTGTSRRYKQRSRSFVLYIVASGKIIVEGIQVEIIPLSFEWFRTVMMKIARGFFFCATQCVLQFSLEFPSSQIIFMFHINLDIVMRCLGCIFKFYQFLYNQGVQKETSYAIFGFLYSLFLVLAGLWISCTKTKTLPNKRVSFYTPCW